MESIAPRYSRPEPSPRIQDSAFPPFKVEHRYRGVYERAGFDIYRGERSNSGSRSGTPVTLNHSTFSNSSGSNTSPTDHSHPSIGKVASPHYTTENHHYKQYPQPLDGQNYSYHNKSVQSFGNSYEKSNQSTNNYYGTDYNTRNKSHGDLYSKPNFQSDNSDNNVSYNKPLQSAPPSNPNTAFTSCEDLESSKNYSGSTAVSSVNDGPIFLKQDTSGVDSTSDFDFSPPSNQNKNVMGLSLDLKNQEFPHDDLDHGDEADISNDVPDEVNRATKDISQAASINTLELLDTPEKKKLTNKQLSPSTSPLKNNHYNDLSLKNQRLSGALDSFRNDFKQPTNTDSNNVPTIEINRFSYENHTSNSNPSHDFSSFKQTLDEPSNSLNTDYQSFLQGNQKPTNDFRKSQLSMVSSIISKESKYSDDDNDDSEVEKELERQLQSLKAGGSSELLSGMRPRPQPENESIKPSDELDGSQLQPIQIPEIIEPINQVPTITIDDESDIESVASIRPLSVHSKNKKFELPDITQTPKQPEGFQDELVTSPPKSSAPYPQTFPDEEESTAPYPLKSPEFNEEDSIPVVKLDKTVPKFKYPSGSGPCRSCNLKISPTAKGGERAIYSKTGELTGQWHRSCFQCSYENCFVDFNKNVQCYVLDDEAYCNHHYHELNNSLCESCRIGIEGECIENELSQKWHLNCLKCVKCFNNINADYYLINDSIYCEIDALNIISGNEAYNENGNYRNGLTTNDKIEKRRTRLMHID